MNAADLRTSFLDFFAQREHAVVPSSSLLPDDPSVLLTTAGMQQFKPYYSGAADPMKSPHHTLGGKPLGQKSATSVQKSFRTSDIDEVGDKTHLTFFEMLGNFSFGGYLKEEAIKFSWEFLTSEEWLGINSERIFVTVHESTPLGRDEESYDIWKNKVGLKADQIRFGGIEDNFWGPTGNSGPCGPSTEIYIDGVEIWNIVFNQYFSEKSREESFRDGWKLKDLATTGVDTGMGLERLAVAVEGKEHIFETSLFAPLVAAVPAAMDETHRRVVADHTRATAFLLTDGVRPSNKEAGYILRRIMRRAIVVYYLFRRKETDNQNVVRDEVKAFFGGLFEIIKQEYGDFYPEVKNNAVQEEFNQEADRFMATLSRGMKELEKMDAIDAPSAFRLYESFGLPFEVIREVAPDKAKNLTREAFDEEFEKHRAKSRAGSEAKFGGHGLVLDTGELKARNEEEVVKVTRLHTATHLLQAALRDVLGESVHQAGSDITAERLRFDFTFDRKLTDEEVNKVEEWVNGQINKDLTVTCIEMPYEEAVKTGALYFTKEKYPEKVKVYVMGEHEHDVASKELCGGPHVEHTGQVGTFKITKQDSVSAGVRRIRATVA